MVTNPGGKSYAALALALVIGFTAWGQNAAIESWADIIEVGKAIPLIGTLAAIGLSWLGQSPLKK